MTTATTTTPPAVDSNEFDAALAVFEDLVHVLDAAKSAERPTVRRQGETAVAPSSLEQCRRGSCLPTRWALRHLPWTLHLRPLPN
jgi:hypothetical protein